MKLTLRIFDAVKAVVPEHVALGIRISAADWVEGRWGLDQSIALAKALDDRDCAYIHVSGGGLDPEHQPLSPLVPGYQLPFAQAIKGQVGVGLITESKQAEAAIAEGRADLAALGRAILYNPRWPWHAAAELGAHVNAPWQYESCAPAGARKLFSPAQEIPEAGCSRA